MIDDCISKLWHRFIKVKTVMYEGREVTPSKIICIGRNYVEHVKEFGNEIPDEMVIFLKPNSSLSGDLHSFQHEQIHYEGELSFLYDGGTFSAVGFGLDLTKRDLQGKLIAKGLPWERAKAFDGSAVFSEFVPFSGDFDSLTIRLKIDGLTVQSGGTDLMISKPDDIFNEVSRIITMNDGDIVMTGTPKGVGEVKAGSRFEGCVLKDNQVIVSDSWTAK